MVVLLPRNSQQIITASPSLASVNISDCHVLESFLEWGLHSKLKTLQLFSSKMLFSNYIHWDLQRLSCLELLTIWGWEDGSFPDERLLPTTLTGLTIEYSDNLKAINGMAFRQLTSLTYLHILHCESIRCLPEEGLPASLSELSIRICC